MALSQSDIDQIAAQIETLDHVVSTRYWAKGDHERLYVEVQSQNNKTNDSKIYVDLKAVKIVAKLEKGPSGAKSYAWSVEVKEAAEKVLDVLTQSWRDESAGQHVSSENSVVAEQTANGQEDEPYAVL